MKKFNLRSNKKIVFLILIVSLIMLVVAYSKIYSVNLLSNEQKQQSQINYEAIVDISGQTINVEVAENSAEKAKGLSGKTHLAENEGMIFVFPQKTYPSFWMVDMNFPLDIIWISDDTIVDIDENLPIPKPGQNNSSLPLHTPSKPVNYVLEVKAGFTDNNNIKVGDKVDIKI